MSTLIDRFDARNFRGVQSFAAKEGLPLDAPLTLLVAANGTGKTSVVDGLEWLLTGDVERFCSSSNYPAMLRNIQGAAGEPMSVGAMIRSPAGKEAVPVRRKLEAGDAGKTQLASGLKPQKLKTEDWLKRLTPPSLTEAGKKSADIKNAQVTWLRAVRFLGPETLAELISNSGKAVANRSALFASVAGADRLRRAHDDLARVAGKFAVRGAEFTEAEQELILRKNERDATAAGDVTPILESFSRQLAEWAEQGNSGPILLLNEFATVAERASWLNRIEDHYRSAKDRATQRHAELKAFASEQTRFETSTAVAASWIAGQKFELQQAVATAEAVALADAGVLTVAMAEREQLLRLRSELTESASVRRLTREGIAHATAELESIVPEDIRQLTGPDIELREIELAAEKLSQLIVAQGMQGAIDREKDVRRFHRRAEEAERKIQELTEAPLPESAELEEREKVVACREAELRQRRAALEQQTGLWHRWNLQLKPYLNEWADRQACPLCGHDHSSSGALHHAIQTTLLPMPPELDEASKRLADEDEALRNERAAWEAARGRRQQFDQNTAALKSAEAELARFRQEMGKLGFDGPFDEIWPRLEERQRGHGEIQRKTTAELERYGAIRVRYDALVGQWFTRLLSRDEKEPLPAIISVLTWAKATLAALVVEEAERTEALAKLESRLAMLREKQFNAETTAKESAQRRDRAREALVTREAEVAQADSFLRMHRTRAVKLELTEPFGPTVFAAQATVESELRDTAEAERRIAGLRQRLDEARAIEVAAAEHGRLAADIARLEATIVSLNRRKVIKARLEARIAELAAAIENEVRRVFHAFAVPMRALFLRAQANAYVEDIDLKAGEHGGNTQLVARTQGEAGGGTLTIAELSQGQRQDLALALFLARAQHEGGSFFLDEPLSHLDDMNRVALLDSLRALVLSSHGTANPVRLVLTTASHALMRHLKAKFFHLETADRRPFLRVIELQGNATEPLRMVMSSVPV